MSKGNKKVESTEQPKEEMIITAEMETEQQSEGTTAIENLLNKVAELEEKLKVTQPIVQVVTGDKKQEPPGRMTQAQENFLNERVPFRAFKDGDKYKDDISVQVNGKIFLIQRGVPVMIPRYILLALEQSERQLAEAATLEARLVDEFEGKRRVLE